MNCHAEEVGEEGSSQQRRGLDAKAEAKAPHGRLMGSSGRRRQLMYMIKVLVSAKGRSRIVELSSMGADGAAISTTSFPGMPTWEGGY